MSKLDRGLGNAVGLAEVDDSLHLGFLGIVPETSAAGNDSSHLRNVGGFREDQPCPPIASWPKCIRCQSCIWPSPLQMYWHIARHDDTVL